jgi:eukaryotic-like serine/threonine-protein kinase
MLPAQVRDPNQTAPDGPDAVVRELERQRPGPSIEAQQAFEQLRDRLFGQAPRPVQIDRYLVRERIGAGGMGLVYRALDPDLDREVAIKIVRTLGSQPEQQAARMLREAQAMAQVEHPNVVRVYDVGSYGPDIARALAQLRDDHGPEPRPDDAGVFIVMELIDGTTLDRYLDERSLDWRGILGLYLDAGQALHAAHQVGLVHRDFKPGNVLVDDLARVCVVDFGLARAAAELIAEPDKGPVGGSGTPVYMAPEQHERRGSDPRTDQFSFCVALYEALYGVVPFAGDSFAELHAAKLRGAIREPSRKLRLPRRVQQALRRGLAAEPDDRFPSMAELLRELEIPRLATRRWLVIGLLVAAAATIAVLGTSRSPRELARICEQAPDPSVALWNPERRAKLHAAFAATKLGHATDTSARVEGHLDAWVEDWRAQRRETCRGELSATDLTRPVVARRRECLTRAIASLEAAVDVLERADARVVDNAIATVTGLPALADCRDDEQLARRGEPSDDARVVEAEHQQTLADTWSRAGHYPEAASAAELAVAAAVAADDPRTLARVHRSAATIASQQQRLDDAHDHALRGWEAALRAGAVDLEIVNIAWLAYVERQRDDYTRGLELVRVGRARAEFEPPSAEVAAFLDSVEGWLLLDRGELETALARFEAAQRTYEHNYGPEDRRIATLSNAMGDALVRLGQPERARPLFDDALARQRQALGDDHPFVWQVRGNLGHVAQLLGDSAGAVQCFREQLGYYQRSVGEAHVLTARARTNLGISLCMLGDLEGCRAQFEAAAIALEHEQGAVSERALALTNLAYVLVDLGEPEPALTAAEGAIALLSPILPKDHDALLLARSHRGLALLAADRNALARAEFEAILHARDASTRALGDSAKAEALWGLGCAELGLGHRLEATAALEQALELAANGAVGPIERARIEFDLAKTIVDDDPARAKQLADRAAPLLLASNSKRDSAEAVRTWLQTHAQAHSGSRLDQ